MSGGALAWRCAALALVLSLGAACGGVVIRDFPDREDFVFPAPAVGELGERQERELRKGWDEVLAGRPEAAQKRFAKLLRQRPGLVPALAGSGYAQLRAARYAAAAASFDQAVASRADYYPALMGGGLARLRQGEAEASLALYRRATEARPEDALARRRLAEVKLQVTESRLAAARQSLADGLLEEAVSHYEQALAAAPELGGLRVELAERLEAAGEPERALAVLEAHPGADRLVLLALGARYRERGDPARALEAYRRLLALVPGDEDALAAAEAARQELELLHRPPEYRRIPTASRITRADLAALIDVKVTALAGLAAREPPVAVDISGAWARPHILRVLELGLMDVYPNHTFQPGTIVRRGELAQAAARVLDALSFPRAPAPAIVDMSRNNLYYLGAARVVSAGLMDLTAEGAFEAWRPVSGADAVAVLEAVARLVGP
jgi:tetratricopeptide (TPR) repeat protein